ncbi:MAG: acyl-CoA dehydrogenase family protein [Chloroflexi bacterium]|nr:acyl-CoA dehydrogenase family protein [Chloroflexota bacterium]
MDFTMPEDVKQIQMLTKRFVRQELVPIEDLVEQRDEYPEDIRRPLIKRSIELGIRNMETPVKFGGGGVGALGVVAAHEEAGWSSEAVTYSIMRPGPGASTAFMEAATEQQRQKYMYPVLRGEREGCAAWTEPDAGGDAASIKARAVKKGKHWVLNGVKHFCTNADKSDFVIVGAATDPGKPPRERFTQFIIDFGTPGLQLSFYQPMMGRHGLKSFELVLENCEVPAENVLGEVGSALRRTLTNFGHGRLLMAARFVGTAERALEMATSYAKRRVTFGQPIASRQAVQWMLVDMAIDIHATRMMTYHAAWQADQELDHRALQFTQAMVKLHASQMVCRVVDNAIQIHGGIGYSRLLPLERMYRDVRLYRIAEGPDEMMKHVIARYILQAEA